MCGPQPLRREAIRRQSKQTRETPSKSALSFEQSFVTPNPITLRFKRPSIPKVNDTIVAVPSAETSDRTKRSFSSRGEDGPSAYATPEKKAKSAIKDSPAGDIADVDEHIGSDSGDSQLSELPDLPANLPDSPPDVSSKLDIPESKAEPELQAMNELFAQYTRRKDDEIATKAKLLDNAFKMLDAADEAMAKLERQCEEAKDKDELIASLESKCEVLENKSEALETKYQDVKSENVELTRVVDKYEEIFERLTALIGSARSGSDLGVGPSRTG